MMLDQNLNLNVLTLTDNISDSKLEAQEIGKIESEAFSYITGRCTSLSSLTIK